MPIRISQTLIIITYKKITSRILTTKKVTTKKITTKTTTMRTTTKRTTMTRTTTMMTTTINTMTAKTTVTGPGNGNWVRHAKCPWSSFPYSDYKLTQPQTFFPLGPL